MSKLERHWYNRTPLTTLLRPLAALYCAVVRVRRLAYRMGMLRTTRLDVPVVVVGNLTVGGTGKTPLVIWLAEFLRAAGYTPGIVSRGYGGKARSWPQQVRPDSDPVMVGDEAVVIARRSGCPMAVGPERVATGQALLKHAACDLIISDDGLQHYALARDVEIAVIDGVRRFGNGFCLPAGPLREPVSRLQQVDFIVNNGPAAHEEHRMVYAGTELRNLSDTSTRSLDSLKGERVHAIAGIGHPERFFGDLRRHGVQVIEHAFADHHAFVETDLVFGDTAPVIMTEKDAVKCRRFARSHHWYLPIQATLNEEFGVELLELLKRNRHG